MYNFGRSPISALRTSLLPYSMKGDLTLRVLETISNTAMDIGALIEAVLMSPYGSSVNHLERETRRIRGKMERRAYEARRRRRHYEILCRLRRQGFITKNTGHGGPFLVLAEKGKVLLSSLRSRKKNELPKVSYQPAKTDQWIVVAFDIAEEDRRKRSWLRAALRHLGFRMAQKSLWIGQVKIPEEFVRDLGRLHLLESVAIFEGTKTGSLPRIAESN